MGVEGGNGTWDEMGQTFQVSLSAVLPQEEKQINSYKKPVEQISGRTRYTEIKAKPNNLIKTL